MYTKMCDNHLSIVSSLHLTPRPRSLSLLPRSLVLASSPTLSCTHTLSLYLSLSLPLSLPLSSSFITSRSGGRFFWELALSSHGVNAGSDLSADEITFLLAECRQDFGSFRAVHFDRHGQPIAVGQLPFQVCPLRIDQPHTLLERRETNTARERIDRRRVMGKRI